MHGAIHWLDGCIGDLVAAVVAPEVELWLTQEMEATVPLLVLLACEGADHG